MLDMLFLLMSLLLLPKLTKKYWHITTVILMISSIKMLSMMNNTSLMLISPMFMMDQMSSTLIMLSMWITALMMLASYKIFNMKNMPKMFLVTCLILLMSLVISFTSSSMVMFYIAFETSLIPTMVLIMLWGYQPERIQASMYLMIYTIAASLPLLMMIVKMYYSSKHLNMTMPEQLIMSPDSTSWMIWMMMIMAFMVKLPLFSVHLWLPKAHVEAPVAGSMILAAILLKLGGYGLTRMIMIFSYMNKMLMNPIMSIAMVGGVITSMICLRQSDMKSMIAYSSVGHMGLMVAGVLTNSKLGVQAGLSMMISHGMSSSAMFCMANISYGMTQTRSITLTKGMLTIMPVLSLWWFMFCCANMAAPPSINLMSEIMLITSIMSHSLWIIMPLAMISFITVAYSIYLYSATNHGSMLSMSAPMPSILTSDMMLLTMHIIPILALMLKPEIIMSWC